MASSRRTATNENISTFDSAGGKDYSTLLGWEIATDIDLVAAAQSEVLEIYKGNHNNRIELRDATTNSSYFRIVRPAAGEGHSGIPKFDGTVAAFTTSVASNNWTLHEDYSQFQDLCIKTTLNSSSSSACAIRMEACDQAKMIGMLIADILNDDGSNDGTGVKSLSNSGNENFIINSLFHNCEENGVELRDAGDLICYNVTAIDNAERGFAESGGTLTCINCLADNNATEDFDSGVISGNYNASGDGTAPGANSRINQTFTFVASGSDDFHLASNDAGALDFGTDLSADGSFAFDDDIDFETRSGSWDIGFDEFILPLAFPILSDEMVASLIFGRIVR